MSYPDTPKGRLQTKVAEKMATLVGSYLEYPLLPSKRKFLRSEALLVNNSQLPEAKLYSPIEMEAKDGTT